MFIITSCLIILFLLIVFLEDVRKRKISLVWLGCIMLLAIIQQLYSLLTFREIAVNTLINIAIVFINYIILSCYFSIKEKTIVDLSGRHLGAGDTVFAVVICALMSPLNFIVFFLTSLIFSLSVGLSVRVLMKGKFATIPLAGLQALLLACIIAVAMLAGKKNVLNNDEFLAGILSYYGGIN